MARHVIEAGQNFVHKVEVDLPQSQRVDAAEFRHAGGRKAGAIVFSCSGFQFCEGWLCHDQCPPQIMTRPQQFLAVAMPTDCSLLTSLVGSPRWHFGQASENILASMMFLGGVVEARAAFSAGHSSLAACASSGNSAVEPPVLTASR